MPSSTHNSFPELKHLSDTQVSELLLENNIGLTVDEARKIEEEILKRPMTLTEAMVWSIEGSEHCSYRSSKSYLKQFITSGPNVILGPEEDAGIVEIAEYNGEKWGIVMGHESHNHPSQLVPYEGAATGIGGIVRDVNCMGAKVIAVANSLRFGDIKKNKSKWICDGVVDGIGGYGNPIGVPNIAGDIYWSSSFNTNCLVNVISLGLVKSSEIIHSKAPQNADGYDMILVGKPTDNSGFGGVSFASFELNEEEKEKNKGAIQEPNAFLKRHLLDANCDLFNILKQKNLLDKVGFKDLGGGGILCASVELADAGGYGAEIDVDKIHVSMENLPSYVVLAAETQERFMWVCHSDVTPLILEHYNKKWALPDVSKGAKASVVGKIREDGQYVATHQGNKVVDANARDITQGLKYDRPTQESTNTYLEPEIKELDNYNSLLLQIISHENIASRDCVYERYDKTVQGITIIEPGDADAGVQSPLIDEDLPEEIKKIGIALSVDSNPNYSKIDSYWGAVNAVIESMRNVAAVGAVPWAITDCLNFGNPEKPEQMWQFSQGVKGVAEACKNIHLKSHPENSVPIISGNVSFYNETETGSVDPSAIIACLGRLEDYNKAITMRFKQADSFVFLIGKRRNELGGSIFYQLFDEIGANIPKTDFKEVENQIYAITDMIDDELLLSCHDISDGGLVVALSEMCLNNKIGCKINLDGVAESEIKSSAKLFSETGGFIFETEKPDLVKEICDKYEIELIELGKTQEKPNLEIRDSGKVLVDLPVEDLYQKWLNGLRDKLSTSKNLDYKSSGVDIDAGNQAVDRIKEKVKSTFGKNVLTGLGTFGAMYDVSFLKEMENPVLIQSIDGIGTKLKIAKMKGEFNTVGEDIVNHCCNDILCQGAKPLIFLDYIASDKLIPKEIEEIVSGMVKACRESDVSLIGGETAEMPGVYSKGEHDVVGCVIGSAEKNKIITGNLIKENDVVLGLASSGLHTNGFSLVRKIFFEISNYSVESKFEELDCDLGTELLKPHKNYTKSILPILDKINGLAHITGGGLIENIPRILPKDLDVEIKKGLWKILPIFNLIQNLGQIPENEMYRVFNMGIGLVVIVDKQHSQDVMKKLESGGERVCEIGRVVVRGERVVLI